MCKCHYYWCTNDLTAYTSYAPTKSAVLFGIRNVEKLCMHTYHFYVCQKRMEDGNSNFGFPLKSFENVQLFYCIGPSNEIRAKSLQELRFKYRLDQLKLCGKQIPFQVASCYLMQCQ